MPFTRGQVIHLGNGYSWSISTSSLSLSIIILVGSSFSGFIKELHKNNGIKTQKTQRR